MQTQKNIRNFAIISHIDHGKSTLADRFLEITKTVEKNKMKAQMLDSMDLEREKGITIKLQPVRMEYNKFILNLIDTPGHVDFTYEVSRSLSAVEGAILLVDATQGIQAQTIFNLDMALNENLKIIPVVNKIDLPNARIDEIVKDTANLLAEDIEQVEKISAKTGQGVEKIIERIIKDVPSPAQVLETKSDSKNFKTLKNLNSNKIWAGKPKDNSQKPLRALIFDSFFDPYKGVIAYARIVDGSLKKGDKILLMATGEQGEVLDLGVFVPEMKPKDKLFAGEIGWVATGIKEIEKCRVGDTIASLKLKTQNLKLKTTIQNSKPLDNYHSEVKNCHPKLVSGSANFREQPDNQILKQVQNDKKTAQNKTTKHSSILKNEKSELKPLAGYKEPKPMVYASFYLAEEKNFNVLATALKKLKLNDAALTYQGESSNALGQGFRLGFLGLLHLEIISERLKREYNLDLIITSPSVSYRVNLKNQKTILIYSPSDLPDRSKILTVEEPWVKLDIICPKSYLGNVMELLKNYDGVWKDTQYINPERIILKYEAPLSMIIVDFYDQLKSVSSGFASMSYNLIGFRVSDLVKLNILIAGEKAEAFSKIVSRKRAYQEGKSVLLQLKKSLPRQNFVIALQAALEEKIIARENISAFRKDVTAGLYGGDYSRKRKLLEKQKKGKKKMKKMGSVDIPTEAFLAVLRKK